MKKGNFKIDEDGDIQYDQGWVTLNPEDIDNFKKILKIKEKKENG